MYLEFVFLGITWISRVVFNKLVEIISRIRVILLKIIIPIIVLNSRKLTLVILTIAVVIFTISIIVKIYNVIFFFIFNKKKNILNFERI